MMKTIDDPKYREIHLIDWNFEIWTTLIIWILKPSRQTSSISWSVTQGADIFSPVFASVFLINLTYFLIYFKKCQFVSFINFTIGFVCIQYFSMALLRPKYDPNLHVGISGVSMVISTLYVNSLWLGDRIRGI